MKYLFSNLESLKKKRWPRERKESMKKRFYFSINFLCTQFFVVVCLVNISLLKKTDVMLKQKFYWLYSISIHLFFPTPSPFMCIIIITTIIIAVAVVILLFSLMLWFITADFNTATAVAVRWNVSDLTIRCACATIISERLKKAAALLRCKEC